MPIFIVIKRSQFRMWYFEEAICLSLHIIFKERTERAGKSVVDTEDLYRMYLRIRTNENISVNMIAAIETFGNWKKKHFLPWQLNICMNHRDFHEGRGSRSPGTAPVECQNQNFRCTSFLSLSVSWRVQWMPELPDYLVTNKISGVASICGVYMKALF